MLIDDGVLRIFVYDTVSARRAGTVSTGSAVAGRLCRHTVGRLSRPRARPGSMGADEILASVGEGLFVQSVTGIHSGVNPVSGDFSVGAEGL